MYLCHIRPELLNSKEKNKSDNKKWKIEWPASSNVSKKVSEDCLYLNIFVPLDVDLSSPMQSHLPVMVWIHGGDFVAGSASKPLYDGRFISNFTHSVVVSLEYRLGKKDYV